MAGRPPKEKLPFVQDDVVREFVLLMRQLLRGGGGAEYPDKLRTVLAEHSDAYATGATLRAHFTLGPLSPAYKATVHARLQCTFTCHAVVQGRQGMSMTSLP